MVDLTATKSHVVRAIEAELRRQGITGVDAEALADAIGEQRQQGQCGDRRYAIVNREKDADPVASLLIGGARRIACSEEILRDDRRRVDPHDEQCGPAEELHQGELLHDRRHA